MSFGSGSIFPYIIIAAQIYCIVHVFRNRKSLWWLLFILLAPGFGCIWYFFREIQVGQGGGRGPGRKKLVNQNTGNTKLSASMIRAMEDELKHKDTVALRLKIADAHLELGNAKEAGEYYRSCMKGFHKDDPPLLFGLACAEYACSEYNQALKHLKTLNDNGNRFDFITERGHLEARCHEALGDLEKAKELYEGVFNRISGEEARCDYARLLEKLDENDKARELYETILENGKRGEQIFRDRNKEWLDIAASRLKALSS